MRSKLFYYFLIVSSLLIVNSCSKNDNPTSISNKIKSYWFENSSFITTLNFDNSGRITNTVNTSNLDNHLITKNTWRFSSNIITVESFDSVNNKLTEIQYTLNLSGLVENINYSYAPFDSIYTTKVDYDPSNNPIRTTAYKGYATGQQPSILELNHIEYLWLGSNLITAKSYKNNILQSTLTYEYYPTSSNLTPEAYGLPYSLLQSKDLVKRTTSSTPSNSNVGITNYTYTFDTNNRVTSQTQETISSSDITLVKTFFTYY